jgi:hypothetical protein
MLHIEFRAAAIRPPRFQNLSAGAAVTKMLGQPQILLLGDLPEFMAVPGVVVIEKIARAKSRAPRIKQERAKEERDDDRKPIASQ